MISHYSAHLTSSHTVIKVLHVMLLLGTSMLYSQSASPQHTDQTSTWCKICCLVSAAMNIKQCKMTCSLQVVAAPTGSGKTGVLELAILRVMSNYIDQRGAFNVNPGAAKIIYLAPIRALVQEKVKQWQESFGNKLGLTCCEMTGDTDMANSINLDSADIICTTPEKFGKPASSFLDPDPKL